jgi:hypothetical protein
LDTIVESKKASYPSIKQCWKRDSYNYSPYPETKKWPFIFIAALPFSLGRPIFTLFVVI